VYTNSLQNQQMQQQFEQRLAQAQQLPVDTNVHMALTTVRSRNPEFSNYDDVLAGTLERYPAAADAIQAAAEAGDRARLEAAIETAYALAQGDTLKQIVRTPATPETTTTTSDVVAPTTSESREPAPQETPTDAFRSAFHQEMEQRRRGVFVAE